MKDLYARYLCVHCQAAHKVVDCGPSRQLWCGPCACVRPFVRQENRLTAKTWPPPERRED